MKKIKARVIRNIGTEAQWLQKNPILGDGEIALVRFGGRVRNKVGNGTLPFSGLGYQDNDLKIATANTTFPFISGDGPAPAGIYLATESGIYHNNINVDTNGKITFLIWDGESTLEKVESELLISELENIAKTEEIVGKNLLNPLEIDYNKKYSVGSKTITTRDGVAAVSGFMEGVPGESIVVSITSSLPQGVGLSGGYFSSKLSNSAIESMTFQALSNGYQATIPPDVNITGFRINVICEGSLPNNTLIGNFQVEKGSSATPFEPFKKKKIIIQSILPDYLNEEIVASKNDLNEKVSENEIIIKESYNLIDPLKIDFTKQYSPTSTSIKPRDSRYVLSGFMKLEELELFIAWCTVNFPAGFSFSGGYFASEIAQNAIQNIIFENPVSGTGKYLKVPGGLGITGARINLLCEGLIPNNTLIGNFQLEKGEMATTFMPYNPIPKIKKELLPNSSTPVNTSFNSEIWYKYLEGELKTSLLLEKAPKFSRHYLLKDKNLTVGNTGTSLTARSSEHCTLRTDANKRPPLLHSNNLASHLWDKMKWDSQFYRRYDYPSFFTETGVFFTDSNLSEWGDGATRDGLTRYANNSAELSFIIPEGAWQFNFIYRTDSVGVEQVLISIIEGNGLVEVFDEIDNLWKEANGFVFSMRESIPTQRVINYPKPSDGTVGTVTTATKSNTTYQKRLEMRCKSTSIDSRSLTKNVTMQGQTAGRFMYWGCEWSLREFMITYINAARGSHNTQVSDGLGLPRYADNELHGFKPDLLLFELPIHNDGAKNADPYPANYWANLTENFVFNLDFELSLIRRSQDLNGFKPEIIMHSSSIAFNFGGIDEQGKLIVKSQLDGTMMSALDKINQAYNHVLINHPEAGFINSAQRWVEAGNAIFGDLKKATIGSGNSGLTFTKEGSHWNDTGSKIIAKTLVGLFDFV
ncbi:hypothetical protein [Sphingobacterium sp.]|uniref:hypothetical protein n=1 Tax=Sphingobacterium sp. TaxID=341027 RepID=UPI0028A625AA|nr:hypothetical protein [Sphingobacterium sp.]